MSAYSGHLRCPRCGWETGERHAFDGCERCTAEGVGANVHPVYEPEEGMQTWGDEPGIFRWRSRLPLDPATAAVSLSEGETPLLPLFDLAGEFGVAALHLKDETRNPTWSYKDRLAAVAITKAVEADADTVVVATTGNHGAATAAYAAAAGLRCVALTLESVPLTMKVLMQVYGAEVVALRDGPSRWALMAEAVRERGWVPISGYRNPPVGSNPFGIEGYKTIAFELVEQLGATADVVVVPTAYADGLVGIHRGFDELARAGRIEEIPRLVAAEPFGPYRATLDAGQDATVNVPSGPSVAFSVASPVATYQGIHAIRATGGTAHAVGDDQRILDAQREVAASTGIYLENAAALCFPVMRELAAIDWLEAGDTVVVIGTSSGLKDVPATADELPEVPVIEPTLLELDRVLGSEG